MKYEIEATIPVTQYGNIKPCFTIEEDGEETLAMEKLTQLWAKYGEKPLKGATGQIEAFKTILEEHHTFTGEVVMYNPTTHQYFDKDGNQLLSGSAYADSVSPKFDKGAILPKTAKSWGVEERALDELWGLQGRVSTEYGSAIHTALDIWHKFRDIGAKIQEQKGMEQNYALPKNVHIRDIVLEFDKVLGKVGTISEVLISDIKNKMAGRIDLLEVLDTEKKVCRIGDYKTNNELDEKKIKKYQQQLSFYAKILKNKGWNVTGLDIFHYDGEKWEKIELDTVDVIID